MIICCTRQEEGQDINSSLAAPREFILDDISPQATRQQHPIFEPSLNFQFTSCPLTVSSASTVFVQLVTPHHKDFSWMLLFPSACFDPDDSVQSVVSFDQGGEWVPLQKPAESKCDATAKDPEQVDKKKKKKNNNTKMCEFIHSHTAVWITHWMFYSPSYNTSGNMQCADCFFAPAVLSSHSCRVQHGHPANCPHVATKWTKRCGSHPSSWYSLITNTRLLLAQLQGI